MKNLILGLTLLSSISVFANELESNVASCKTQEFLSRGSYIEDSIKYFSPLKSQVSVGGCVLTAYTRSTSDRSRFAIEVMSNNIEIYVAESSMVSESEYQKEIGIKKLKEALKNCACTKL